jgi:hypothetical protein
LWVAYVGEATFAVTMGLVGRKLVDGVDCANRIRRDALEYERHATPQPVQVITHEEVMCRANRRARDAEERARRAEIARLVQSELTAWTNTS